MTTPDIPVFGYYREQLSTKDYKGFYVYLDSDGLWRQSHPTDPKGNDVLVTANNIVIDDESITTQFPWPNTIMFEEAVKHLTLEVTTNRQWINSQVIQKILKTRQRKAVSKMTSTEPPYPLPIETLYACARCVWDEKGWKITYEQKWFAD